MNTFVSLLRAVNVGGAGKLPMSELRTLCERAGFAGVRTFIASGNVVFRTPLPAGDAQAVLAQALHAYAGKPVGVHLRTGAELAAVTAANPFATRAGNLVHVVFLDGASPQEVVASATGLAGEELAGGVREIYVHYPHGAGASKLRLPSAKTGTARNLNTVAKLAEMAAG